MAVNVSEKALSRELNDAVDGASDSALLIYTIHATDADAEDAAAVLTALKAAAPSGYNGLDRQHCRVEPLGGGLWDGSAEYGRQQVEIKDAGDSSSYAFDISSGSRHITQALPGSTTTKYAPPGKTAPDFKGAIGDDGKGNLAGCDISVGVYTFTETHYYADAKITQAYKLRLAEMVDAPLNDDTFRGFAAGEVKFEGASGSRRPDGVWEITFRYAVSKNVTGKTIGTVTGIAKKGWEYLWVLYEKIEDTTANPKRIVQRPAAVYIETVYGDDDFDKLDPDWTP